MIHYDLKCPKGHEFDGWFASASAFDSLLAAGHVACTLCGAKDVEKRIMAPAVRPARKAGEKPKLQTPANELEAAMAELRAKIEKNSEYVGLNFAAEARAMHEGKIDERSIYGEAKPDEARALLEDGIPVAPLPFMPKRQAN
ncbi:DUF1178 family protein [Tabrizicola sp.]|uniref:DUF1178 family protein n=1 Tax=Tabrizicola sp. TaxID=2005166 RepID=UPI003D2A0E04